MLADVLDVIDDENTTHKAVIIDDRGRVCVQNLDTVPHVQVSADAHCKARVRKKRCAGIDDKDCIFSGCASLHFKNMLRIACFATLSASSTSLLHKSKRRNKF